MPPITFKNVGQIDFAASNKLRETGNTAINTGLSGLIGVSKKLATQQKSNNTLDAINKIKATTDNNTIQNLINNNAVQNINGNVDKSAISKALLGQQDANNADIVKQQNFDKQQKDLQFNQNITGALDTAANAKNSAVKFNQQLLIDNGLTLNQDGTLTGDPSSNLTQDQIQTNIANVRQLVKNPNADNIELDALHNSDTYKNSSLAQQNQADEALKIRLGQHKLSKDTLEKNIVQGTIDAESLTTAFNKANSEYNSYMANNPVAPKVSLSEAAKTAATMIDKLKESGGLFTGISRSDIHGLSTKITNQIAAGIDPGVISLALSGAKTDTALFGNPAKGFSTLLDTLSIGSKTADILAEKSRLLSNVNTTKQNLDLFKKQDAIKLRRASEIQAGFRVNAKIYRSLNPEAKAALRSLVRPKTTTPISTKDKKFISDFLNKNPNATPEKIQKVFGAEGKSNSIIKNAIKQQTNNNNNKDTKNIFSLTNKYIKNQFNDITRINKSGRGLKKQNLEQETNSTIRYLIGQGFNPEILTNTTKLREVIKNQITSTKLKEATRTARDITKKNAVTLKDRAANPISGFVGNIFNAIPKPKKQAIALLQNVNLSPQSKEYPNTLKKLIQILQGNAPLISKLEALLNNK